MLPQNLILFFFMGLVDQGAQLVGETALHRAAGERCRGSVGVLHRLDVALEGAGGAQGGAGGPLAGLTVGAPGARDGLQAARAPAAGQSAHAARQAAADRRQRDGEPAPAGDRSP